jgi:hypothetical protein
MNIIIPDALAAEVDANPERFQPSVAPGQQILVLGSHDPRAAQSGWTARAEHSWPIGIPSLTVRAADDSFSEITAWALVGTRADAASPRPEVAGRVLALDVPGVSAADGQIGVRSGRNLDTMLAVDFDHEIAMDVDGVLAPDTWWAVETWAILPPSLNDLIDEALPARPIEEIRIAKDRRASVYELADVIRAEFGGHRPGETTVRAAIRVLREQRAEIARQRQIIGAVTHAVGVLGPATIGDRIDAVRQAIAGEPGIPERGGQDG